LVETDQRVQGKGIYKKKGLAEEVLKERDSIEKRQLREELAQRAFRPPIS
jgi:hypothetical protein